MCWSHAQGGHSYEVNAPIVSLSFAADDISTSTGSSGLEYTFTVTHLTLLETTVLQQSVLCSWWDFTLNSGSGGWSQSGCRVVSVSSNATVCACTHLVRLCVCLCACLL